MSRYQHTILSFHDISMQQRPSKLARHVMHDINIKSNTPYHNTNIQYIDFARHIMNDINKQYCTSHHSIIEQYCTSHHDINIRHYLGLDPVRHIMYVISIQYRTLYHSIQVQYFMSYHDINIFTVKITRQVSLSTHYYT